MASFPFFIKSQKASTLSAPGKRHSMPIIAIGSSTISLCFGIDLTSFFSGVSIIEAKYADKVEMLG